MWLHDFLSVDITDIKRTQARGATSPSINFTIICSPKSAIGLGPPPPPGSSSSPGSPGSPEVKKEHK